MIFMQHFMTKLVSMGIIISLIGLAMLLWLWALSHLRLNWRLEMI